MPKNCPQKISFGSKSRPTSPVGFQNLISRWFFVVWPDNYAGITSLDTNLAVIFLVNSTTEYKDSCVNPKMVPPNNEQVIEYWESLKVFLVQLCLVMPHSTSGTCWKYAICSKLTERSGNKKQPSSGVLQRRCSKKCSKFVGKHPCRSVISQMLLCNFTDFAHWHGCPPVNLMHIFRTLFYNKNT